MLKSLWAQKKYLEVKRGVLYRRWEDAGGGGVNKCLQLVMPPSTVPSVLTELHDSLSGGHLGVGKVLEKIQARLVNVMTWKNGVDPAIFAGPLKHLLSTATNPHSNSTYGSCCYEHIGSLTHNPTVIISQSGQKHFLYLIWRLPQLLVYW